MEICCVLYLFKGAEGIPLESTEAPLQRMRNKTFYNAFLSLHIIKLDFSRKQYQFVLETIIVVPYTNDNQYQKEINNQPKNLLL